MIELVTIGITNDENEIERLITQRRNWIEKEKIRPQPCLDLFGDESKETKVWILSQPMVDWKMVSYNKRGGRRLLVGYTDDRPRKTGITVRKV